MLVRELIEQLSEMPPELSVYVAVWHTDIAEVRSVHRSGRKWPLGVELWLDAMKKQDALVHFANGWQNLHA